MTIDLQTISKFVINLKSRFDRLDNMKIQLPILFNDPSFEIFEAYFKKGPMLGCALSHLGVIQIAKERNLPFVLVMEDDCIFHAKDKIVRYTTEAFNNVPDDFDLLFGGLYQGLDLSPVNNYWSVIKKFSGTHFYVVHEKAYDKILNGYDKKSHIDRWYTSSELNMYVVREMFVTQKPGYSDNSKRVINCNPLLEGTILS